MTDINGRLESCDNRKKKRGKRDKIRQQLTRCVHSGHGGGRGHRLVLKDSRRLM